MNSFTQLALHIQIDSIHKRFIELNVENACEQTQSNKLIPNNKRIPIVCAEIVGVFNAM